MNSEDSDHIREYDENLEDWYHSSDTSEDIPDPNTSAEALYQDEDHLPEPLRSFHFVEGLIYTMTKHSSRRNSMLVWIIEAKEDTFTYNCYFQQTSSAKTWHQTGKFAECSYDDI